jgi:hypothetical protein
MGQYYYIVNLDKRQFLHPHKFNCGLKLLEFGDGGMAMTGLAVLLADGNNRGGGDLRSDNPIVGSWAGDRIVVAGDYADDGKFLPQDADDSTTLFNHAADTFQDISFDVIRALFDDPYLKQQYLESVHEWRVKDNDHYPDWIVSEWKAWKDAGGKRQSSGAMRPDMVIVSKEKE